MTSVLARLRCWIEESRLPTPVDPEAIDLDVAISQKVEPGLIADNDLSSLWVMLRNRYGPGDPGITQESSSDWIIRTDRGCVAGGVVVHANDGDGLPPSIDVAIDPRYRRRGYATRVYEAIRAAGIDVEAGSDASMRFGTMTKLGYAFMVGRRRKARVDGPGAVRG
jgi:GNAT superfamily N-acetyltransferase